MGVCSPSEKESADSSPQIPIVPESRTYSTWCFWLAGRCKSPRIPSYVRGGKKHGLHIAAPALGGVMWNGERLAGVLVGRELCVEEGLGTFIRTPWTHGAVRADDLLLHASYLSFWKSSSLIFRCFWCRSYRIKSSTSSPTPTGGGATSVKGLYWNPGGVSLMIPLPVLQHSPPWWCCSRCYYPC